MRIQPLQKGWPCQAVDSSYSPKESLRGSLIRSAARDLSIWSEQVNHLRDIRDPDVSIKA